ncbi:hypothetical protein ABZT03_32430 [Streptomyces sp. NPDC005574]|uniref:hypothetical protein n=1 Tax=Streptomyces sp. NPDC005574 TaxID=3156891 RepID=UPI0033BE688E
MSDDLGRRGPRVSDDMTVEVAEFVMTSARVEHLVLCDADDQSTGSVSRAQLTLARGSSTYTDRVRLRDILGGSSASLGVRTAAVGENGIAPGVHTVPADPLARPAPFPFSL